METEGLMDIQDVATFLKISAGTLYHWVSERRGPPYVRLSGGCLRWRRSDVNAWVAERVEKPEQMQRRRRTKSLVAEIASNEEKGAPMLQAEQAGITGGAAEEVRVWLLKAPEEE